MSGKGPNTSFNESRHTKQLAQQLEEQTSGRNNTDAQFKKATQVVGQPQTSDHNVMDDYIKNPPHNGPGQPAADRSFVAGSTNDESIPNTVEAKPVDEIKERIGQKD